MAVSEHTRRAALAAEMEMLRAEIRALGKRLSEQQMIELADLMRELAGVPGEPRSWNPQGASKR